MKKRIKFLTKNIVLSFFIFGSLLFAAPNNIQKIKEQIFLNIVNLLIKNKEVKVYVNSSEFNNIDFSKIKNVKIVKSCKQADICFVDKEPKNIKNKIIFATNYYLFYKDPNILGAFFWQKGRPVIFFKKKMLEKYHINLPPEYSSFIF